MRSISSLRRALCAATLFVTAAIPAHAAIIGFDNGVSTAQNGSASVAGTSATLTNNYAQNGSVFFSTKQAYGTFTADFDYTASLPLSGFADGFSFTLQNDSRGTAALGANDYHLGYGGPAKITPSVALLTNLYVFRGRGVRYTSNGASFGSNGDYTTPGSIDLVGGPVHYHVTYDGTTLTSLLTQGVNSFSTGEAVDLGAILDGSGLAYVGFTGGTQGYGTTQVISNFRFDGAAVVVGPGGGGGGGAGVPLPMGLWSALLVLGACPLALRKRNAMIA